MKFLLAALLAAIISFAWGFVSWMVMSWHDQGMHDFKDEAAVSEVIKENSTHGTGLYVLPYPRKAVSYADPAEQKRLEAGHRKANDEGPYMYAIVRPGRHDWNMNANLGWSFGRSLLAALILGALLHQTVLAFPARLTFCAAAGLFAGVVCILPQMVWFELPQRDVIVGVADYVIEWTLAGVVLALFLGKEPTDRDLN
ncbi:hypothetical protein EI77_02398 [Prosthecobacter fusiformis]|uniref:Uncharacterized protein n=1 Tax=Prosthecobacter fusiformis TaxID=48464 RepID=A0A4R7S1C0_9BACT|nr:hypothetical protein [Prosthecobacter fusiformis]TDU71276.1 hypothetical protein EI77_02398 [Prosthecobacter fusiformis]